MVFHRVSENVNNRMSCRVSQNVESNQTRLRSISDRINLAQAKITKIKGSKKATKVRLSTWISLCNWDSGLSFFMETGRHEFGNIYLWPSCCTILIWMYCNFQCKLCVGGGGSVLAIKFNLSFPWFDVCTPTQESIYLSWTSNKEL